MKRDRSLLLAVLPFLVLGALAISVLLYGNSLVHRAERTSLRDTRALQGMAVDGCLRGTQDRVDQAIKAQSDAEREDELARTDEPAATHAAHRHSALAARRDRDKLLSRAGGPPASPDVLPHRLIALPSDEDRAAFCSRNYQPIRPGMSTSSPAASTSSSGAS